MSYLFAFSYCSWGSQGKNTEVAQWNRSDRVPDELWMEVLDIVQETGIKTIPMEKKYKKKKKKAKRLSGEAIQV